MRSGAHHRRLSVFAGGWTLEAAEAICADQRLPTAHILDLLASLVDRSLVVAEGQETIARYRLLETLREFGAEHLHSAEEADSVRDRHLEWYLALAERGNAALHGPEQTRWITVMESEHDNLRAALRWSLDNGTSDRALALATACAYFWEIRGHRYRTEARRWLDETLGAASERLDPKLRARALYWGGTFAAEQFEFSRAETLLQHDLSLCEQARDVPAALELVAEMLAAHQPRSSARLFGLADSLRESLGLPLPPVDRGAYTAALTQVRAAVDAESFDAAWSDGRHLNLDQALELVAADQIESKVESPIWAALTPREREVVTLIGRGNTRCAWSGVPVK